MNTHRRWSFKTAAGTFRVVFRNEFWRAMFESEDLGAYILPDTAAYEIASGTTFWPSVGDPQRLRVPKDLSDWEEA